MTPSGAVFHPRELEAFPIWRNEYF
ncbi:hypothetical protein [Grimontia sp. AD028]